MEVKRGQGGKKRRPMPRQAPKDDRTKFDKWLERCRESQLEVHLSLSDGFGGLGRIEDTELQCRVLEVDRYFLFVDIKDRGAWWINKGTIVAATYEDG